MSNIKEVYLASDKIKGNRDEGDWKFIQCDKGWHLIWNLNDDKETSRRDQNHGKKKNSRRGKQQFQRPCKGN